MNKLFVLGLFVFGIIYVIKGSTGILNDLQNGNAALLMDGITSEELHNTIIAHYANTVLEGVGTFTADAIETTIADLNEDGKKDVIAIVESAATCGSGGCIASIFMENELGELSALPFAYAVKNIIVLESLTEGMHDLRVNDDETHRMVWNGTTYVPERI